MNLRILILALNLLVFSATPSFGYIHELSLSVENLDCPWCPKELQKALIAIPGIDKARVWREDGVALATWKEKAPFAAINIFRAVGFTKFAIRAMAIDVEGRVLAQRCSMRISSEPDLSIFYVDNRGDSVVLPLKDGDMIRCKGLVSNQQGFNFLTIKEVVWVKSKQAEEPTPK